MGIDTYELRQRSPGTIVMKIDGRFKVGMTCLGTTKISIERDRGFGAMSSSFYTSVELSLREFIDLYKNMTKTLDLLAEAQIQDFIDSVNNVQKGIPDAIQHNDQGSGSGVGEGDG